MLDDTLPYNLDPGCFRMTAVLLHVFALEDQFRRTKKRQSPALHHLRQRLADEDMRRYWDLGISNVYEETICPYHYHDYFRRSLAAERRQNGEE